MILGWIGRGFKLYIGGRRIHHGRVGKWLAVLGIALMLDDLFDYPWPTKEWR